MGDVGRSTNFRMVNPLNVTPTHGPRDRLDLVAQHPDGVVKLKIIVSVRGVSTTDHKVRKINRFHRVNIMIRKMNTRSGFIFVFIPNISPHHCRASSADEDALSSTKQLTVRP